MIRPEAAFNNYIQTSTADVTGMRIECWRTDKSVTVRTWRLVDARTTDLDLSLWQWIYGTDIFLNGWPVLKIFAGLVLLGAWVITTL